MPLARSNSFSRSVAKLVDDGQASAEIAVLKEKVATLSHVSSAQAEFFNESRSCLQREIDELRRQVQVQANEHQDDVIALQAANAKALQDFRLTAQKNVESVRQQVEGKKQALEAELHATIQEQEDVCSEQAQTIQGYVAEVCARRGTGRRARG